MHLDLNITRVIHHDKNRDIPFFDPKWKFVYFRNWLHFEAKSIISHMVAKENVSLATVAMGLVKVIFFTPSI